MNTKRKRKRKKVVQYSPLNSRVLMKRRIISFANRFMVCVIIFLIALIVFQKNPDCQKAVQQKVYENNFPFMDFRQIYDKYIGNLFFSSKGNNDTPVFEEKLVYQNIDTFNNGAKLEVGYEYLVPALESGIIVFVGEKDDLGKTVIVQQVNGVDVWYSNIELKEVKLYDYVEKGSLLGKSLTNFIYLYFKKDGNFLDYKQYLT